MHESLAETSTFTKVTPKKKPNKALVENPLVDLPVSPPRVDRTIGCQYPQLRKFHSQMRRMGLEHLSQIPKNPFVCPIGKGLITPKLHSH